MVDETRVIPANLVASTLAAIVPLYNEERTVAELLTRLVAQDVVSEVVVVDDGCTDQSVSLVQGWLDRLDRPTRDRITLLHHTGNRGKGRAIRTGLECVTCSHVIIQDADLEYDPADIPKLWTVMQSGAADAVFGSRYLDNPKLQKGRWVLQSGIRLLNVLVRFLFGVTLTDEATCYKLFRVRDLKRMDLAAEKFDFCPEVTAKVTALGLQIVEVPISYESRGQDAGKKLRWSDGWTAVIALVRWRKWSPTTRAENEKIAVFALSNRRHAGQLHSADANSIGLFSRVIMLGCAVAAMLLVVGGVSKLWSTQSLHLFPYVVVPRRGVVAIGLLELVIGMALIARPGSKRVRTCTALWYLAFIFVLTARAAFGLSSCGCLPGLEVPLYRMLLIDVCLAVLMVASWKHDTNRRLNDIYAEGDSAGKVWGLLRGTTVAFLLICCVGALFVRSFDEAIQYVSGERIVVDQRAKRVENTTGDEAVIPFLLTNKGTRTICINGAQSSCRCSATDNLPHDLTPSTTFVANIRIRRTLDGSPATQAVGTAFYLSNKKTIYVTAIVDWYGN